MLVYLDHSHLVLLADTAADAPSKFASFMTFWRGKDFTLALSRVHLVEMRRHADPATREKRYRLLEHFAPFRSDIGPRTQYPQSVLELEITAAFGRKILKAQQQSGSSVTINVFPETFDDAVSIQALRALEDPIFDQFLKIFHAGVETSVEAQSRPRGEPYKPAKASELSREPMSKEEGDAALAELEAVLARDATLSSLYGGADAATIRQVVEPLLDRIRGFIRRCQEVGPALAYAEFIGVGLAELGNKRMDRTVQESVFRDEARRLAGIFFKEFTPDVASSMADSITIHDCPGYSLACQLDLEIRAAEPVQDPSNVYDVDHVTYLPYVDLFFADKRIAGYVRRILKRSTGMASDVVRRGPHTTALSVSALRDALEAHSRTGAA